ncbi:hypothetical protein BU17DRAFT_95025 [Hysterangium stoloniferum]|nr:hypothetical protein BU17DRAFT_95025 [Hysterangium stoloniferum]
MAANPSHPKDFGILKIADPRQSNIDIVFIHGLDGHRVKSYTHTRSGEKWLRDFLPSDLRQARILSFGYNGYTEHRNQFSEGTLSDHGRGLLKISHRQELDQPIIFVAHNVGGIILKSALVFAYSCHRKRHSDLRRIYDATKGIIYLGTPHKDTPHNYLDVVLHSGTSELAEKIKERSEKSYELTEKLRAHSEKNEKLSKNLKEYSERNDKDAKDLKEHSERSGRRRLAKDLKEHSERSGRRRLAKKLKEHSEQSGGLAKNLEGHSERKDGLAKNLKDHSKSNMEVAKILKRHSEKSVKLAQILRKHSNKNTELAKNLEEHSGRNNELKKNLERHSERNAKLAHDLERQLKRSDKLTKNLNGSSGWFQRLFAQERPILAQQKISIEYFYEATAEIKSSSSRENANTKESVLMRNHEMLTKFESRSENDYQAIKATLQIMARPRQSRPE